MITSEDKGVGWSVDVGLWTIFTLASDAALFKLLLSFSTAEMLEGTTGAITKISSPENKNKQEKNFFMVFLDKPPELFVHYSVSPIAVQAM